MRKTLGAILVGAMLLIAKNSNALEGIGGGVGYDILRKSPVVELNAGGIDVSRDINLTAKVIVGKTRSQQKNINARKYPEGYGGYCGYSGTSNLSGYNIGLEIGLEHKIGESHFAGITVGGIRDFVNIDSHIIQQHYRCDGNPVGDPILFSHKSYFRGITPTIGVTIKSKQGKCMDGISLNYVFSPKCSRIPDVPEHKDPLFRNKSGWRLSMIMAYAF